MALCACCLSLTRHWQCLQKSLVLICCEHSGLLPPGQKTNNCDGNEGGNTSRSQWNSMETSAALKHYTHTAHISYSERRRCQGNVFAIIRYFFASACVLSGSHKDRNSKQQWSTEPLMPRMRGRCWVKRENSDYTSFKINRRLVTEKRRTRKNAHGEIPSRNYVKLYWWGICFWNSLESTWN